MAVQKCTHLLLRAFRVPTTNADATLDVRLEIIILRGHGQAAAHRR